MRTSRFNKNKRNPVPLLYGMTRRTILFLYFFHLSIFLFFIFGNYQKFLDSTLTILIKLDALTSTALITFCVAGIIESIVYMATTKIKTIRKFCIDHIILMFLCLINSIATLFIFRAINILSLGVN